MHRSGIWAVVLFVGIGCGPSQPPLAGGKPLEHWLEKIHDKEAPERVEAVKKLGNIGNKSPRALPAVFEALSDPAPAVRKEAVYAVVRNWPASRSALSTLAEIKEKDEDTDIRTIASEAYENLTTKK